MAKLPRSDHPNDLVGIPGSVYDQMADAIETPDKIVAGPGISQSPGVNGSVVISAPPPTQEWYTGVIVSAGPSGQSNYTDARYWVQFAYVSNKASPSTDPLAIYPKTMPAAVTDIVTATNLAEVMATTSPGVLPTTGTHTLPANTPVMIRQQVSPVDGQRRWMFSAGGAGGVSPGQYQGQVYTMITDNQTGWEFPMVY